MSDEIERIWEATFTSLPTGAADEAIAGLVRLREGRKLTTRQVRALAGWQRGWLSAIRERLFASIPTSLWQKWSGCRRQQLVEQAQTYNLPIAGKSIDLPALARAIHRFLADSWLALREAKKDVGAPAEPASPELERWRKARADMAQLNLDQRLGDLVDRREFQPLLLRIAHIMRGCGDTIQRQYGPDAQNVLDEGIAEVLREIDRHFATYDDGDGAGRDVPPADDVKNDKGG